MKTPLRLLIVVCFFLFAAWHTQADSQPITGTAVVLYANNWTFSLNGPSLSAFSSFPDGPEGFFECSTPGAVCDLDGLGYATIPVDSQEQPFLSFQGNAASYFTGDIAFSGSFVLPILSSSSNVGVTLIEPVSMSGVFYAYSSYGGPLLYTVNLTGEGTLQLVGFYGPVSASNSYIFQDASYTYSGLADVTTPEPSSGLLLLTGLFLLLTFAMARRWIFTIGGNICA